MAQLIPNSFASYILSPEEEESGQVLNQNQKMVLQNKLSTIAEEKIRLTYDASMPTVFAQREAELQGQMSVIQWLLDSSERVEEEIKLRTLASQGQ